MCKFFSLCSTGDGKALYFDAKIRKKILKKELSYELDSHTSTADYFGHKAGKEDKLNKYEYNVFTKYLTIDFMGAKDDSKEIKGFCDNLDFKTIVPELRIKPIIHPFKDIQTLKITEDDINLLKDWASVRDSVGDSVRAYVATFFDIKYKCNLEPTQKLWEWGLVASFDGEHWRLHGKDGKEVYKTTAEKLRMKK